MCPQQFDLAFQTPILRCTDDILGVKAIGFGQKLKDVGFTIGDAHQTDFRGADRDSLA
jgi:hypothetical protein